MDLQCILCIANSSYAVKTPKDEVSCDTYCNFYKKLKIWTCFPQSRRFRDQTGGWETTSKNGRVGTYAFFYRTPLVTASDSRYHAFFLASQPV